MTDNNNKGKRESMKLTKNQIISDNESALISRDVAFITIFMTMVSIKSNIIVISDY